ncbi:uncharacterized protein LOC109544010 isoform X2 [Dendroctonus ponderosae]|uniref:uncharacterized protein LOC109544010 isoform X2 n=1 Tax=Dendroctonus ponderosae TaxID=77166 RepID=UPI0020365346|nr:uncharacterized protein LOC109544010 isoform X2 [Dendroctonus ponderosae]
MYVCIGARNMELYWRWGFYLTLLFVDCCTGFPVNLQDNGIGEHTQLLTSVAAILITVGTIIIFAGCLCCHRRKGFQEEKQKEFHNTPMVASTVTSSEQGHVNPIGNGEFTIFTPLHPPINNNVFMVNEQERRIGDAEHVDVGRWFDGAKIDFPREKLKYIRELGNGHFGKVVEGAAQDLDPDRTWTPVVVRILDIASSPRDRLSFLQNALFYLAPEHPNILALKGQCLRSAPLLLLQESCSAGDLKSRLRTVGSEDRILQWCFELTSALKHLHENNLIHPDLAARNCQLSSDLTLKLGDYSLSFSKYPEDYYRNGVPLIPVRWRSPESLVCTPTTIQPKPLTKEANVWSLGVVMWEVCENGSQPYGFLNDDDVISRVFGPESLRLDGPSKPQMYSDYIFRLIKMCWSNKESRPQVAQIEFMLSDLYQVHRNTHNLGANSDFDQRWESLKPNVTSNTDKHTVNIEMQTKSISKQLSPSLNNLHGSLDNLLCMQPLTKNAKDMNPEATLHFKLGSGTKQKTEELKESPIPNDSLTDSFNFKQASSGSDTEEENWRRKVERGAYSEKVRLKSRSVADLMVLTHVDYSESESETPMPSIDYKSNRGPRKSNLENVSLNFSSEGNLLSLEDTFEQELKKMQVERRDSLLFVPDNKSQNLSVLRELNSATEIKPPNQIYNVFNVSVDKYRPMPTGIHMNKTFSRQDSETKKIEDESDKHPPKHNLPDILASLDEDHGQANVDLLESNLIPAKSAERDYEEESQIPKDDPELNESKAEIKESQIVPDLCSENVENSVSINSCLSYSPEKMVSSEPKARKPDVFTDQFLPEIKPQFIKGPNMMEARNLSSPSPKETCNSLPQICLGVNEFLSAERKTALLETTAPSENCNSTNSEVPEICDVPPTSPPTDSCENKTGGKLDSELPNLPKVAFDVSDSQQESKPNLLTHALVFSSTPFGKKSSITFTEPPGVNLFDSQTNDSNELFTSAIKESGPNQEEKLNYSLETWDNFLGKSFDSNRETNENFFDSFTSEPQSMLFLEENIQIDTNNEEIKGRAMIDGTFLVEGNNTFTVDNATEQLENQTFTKKAADGTFSIEPKNDSSATLLDAAINGTFVLQDSPVDDGLKDEGNGEDLKTCGGWFLHPQLNNEQLAEEIESQASTSSYIRYGMDDEVVSALRNELLAKLPQAQSAPQENIKEEEEWNQAERNEIFLRYNAYNTMLSPIPEENSFELNDEEMGMLAQISPKYEDSDSDWSDELPPALSSHTNDSVFVKNAQTASQSSCCSNDTLFNFDDFASANEKEPEDIAEAYRLNDGKLEDVTDASEEKTMKLGETTESFSDSASNEQKNEEVAVKPSGGEYPIYLNAFLENERHHSADFPAFPTKVVAPLPSPEDKPWKSLPASLLTFKSIQSPSLSDEKNEDFCSKPDNEDNLYESLPSETYYSAETTLAKEEELDVYKFPFADEAISNIYENLDNNVPYVNVAYKSDSAAEESHDMLGVLTDIRFSGPIDSQLMSTSFSESNEAEEQDWESGSDTRSSSSGEFIWKEGEHEESLKALKAAPQDMLEDIQPMEEIVEESTERDISTSSSEEEGDNLEFVPSAWDKFATPSKSALRSPDKSLDRAEMKKSKGVWFKKQKYHCVYEYPREPESPVLQSQDLWKPQLDFVAFADWEFDPEICLPPPTAESDLNPSNFTFKPKINNSRRSLYYLTSPIDFQGDGSSAPRTPDYDCQVVPTNRQLDDTGCSQFFPGASSWMENITPDSGLEDCTPVSESSGFSDNFASFRPVASLRKLAEQAVNRSKNNEGGLRHTRSKLKLDLPPSPSAFTSGKTFVVEPLQDMEIIREKPAFSTFGKSRFLVQHVDTPTDENLPQTKNVCFDVLPYKPINIIPVKSETVLYELLNDNFVDKKGHFNKGEASLLDSADEDSGIESSTLERKSKAIQRDNVKTE